MEYAIRPPLHLTNILRRRIPSLTPVQLERLTFDLSGLYWGMRKGTLIDCMLMSEEQARQLGVALAEAMPTSWHEHLKSPPLFVVYDPTTGQTLAVHRYLTAFRDTGITYCVEVGGSTPVVLEQLPPASTRILKSIACYKGDAPFLRLPPVERPHDLVAAVGHLIDYPVPYCISNDDGSNCLGGQELVVMEAYLVGREHRQKLNSFSYPAMFDGELFDDGKKPLRARSIASMLESHFIGTCARATEKFPKLLSCGIKVEWHKVALEQVAL
ncbi:hypothetical protein JCM11641_002427 [Rhodosporidiobolus odoratus]